MPLRSGQGCCVLHRAEAALFAVDGTEDVREGRGRDRGRRALLGLHALGQLCLPRRLVERVSHVHAQPAGVASR